MAIWINFWFQPGIQNTNKKNTLVSSIPSNQKTNTMPQKPMMSYNVKVKEPSEKYPMLEKSEERDIDKQLESIWWNNLDKQLMKEELYKKVVTAKQSKAFLDDREKIRSKIITSNISNQVDNTKLYKQSQFADIMRNIALWQWANNIFEVNDNEIINKTISADENMNNLYNEFIQWNINSLELKDKITWTKRLPEWEKKFWNFVKRTLNKEELTDEQRDKAATEWKIKSLWATMTEDFWAAPSVVAWWLTVPAKMVSWWAKLLWKAFGKKWWFNDSIDDLVKKSGIQKDTWFDVWKMATEIWISAMAINWILANVSKVWQLANVVKQNPILQKYMAKPLLKLVSLATKATTEWLWYQATADLEKWTLSSKKDYLTSAAFNLWFNALWKISGAIKSKILPAKKILKNAVQSVDDKVFNKMVTDTKLMKWDINAPHVYDNITKKIDKALTSIIDEKWTVGAKIWEYRNALDNISLWEKITRQSIVDDFINILQDKANTTVTLSSKWVPKITNFWYRTSAWSIEWADKTLIKDTVTLIKQAQKWMKASSLESLQTNLKWIVKTSNATATTKKAISDYISWLWDKLEIVAKDNWLSKAKQEYSKLIWLQEQAKKIASEGWNKAINALRKMASVWEWIETKQLINELKNMWLIKWDVVQEAYVANYIMSQILEPQEFQRALQTIYPSVPWVLETWIRWLKQLVSPNTIWRIGKYTKWYNKYSKWQTLAKSWIKRQATNKTDKTEQ